MDNHIPDCMHMIFNIRFFVPAFKEFLDSGQIFNFAPFKALAIVKHKLLIRLEDDFFVDVRFARLDR